MSILALPSASAASLQSLTDPPVVSAILLDQTAAFDPAAAEPEPDVAFDQSLPPSFDD